MERRFQLRLEELLEDAVLDPRIPEGMLDRLERFVEPFAARLASSEQRQHTREYVAGLFSDVKRKNSETIAYLHDQDRHAMQKFIGQSPWANRPLIEELAQQVGRELGEPDGVLVFDPSAFKKQGKDSVGVARQWCGRLGKIDNCQVGVYLGYVSRKEHALVDVRLYLNQEWAKDKKRREKCGVPREIRFRTRHALALEMLVVLRETQDDGTIKHDYYLSNALPETPLQEFARVAKAEHRIEECLDRAKGEAGLAQYQVRNWLGWHHHQTLSLLATWFLTQEDRRGKKIHPGAYGPEGSHHHRRVAPPRPRLRLSGLHRAAQHSGAAAKRECLCVPLEIT
jgi:SRSO17 transposase